MKYQMIMMKLILMKPIKNVNKKEDNKEDKEFNVKTNDVCTYIYSNFFIIKLMKFYFFIKI